MTDVRKWLNEVRGIKTEILDLMGVKVVKHPALGEAIAFPYRRNAESYAAKFRTLDKRWSSTAGVPRGLFNEDELVCAVSLPVVITEGEIDCLSVIQAGFERAVSLPDGWTEQGNKTQALLDAEQYFRQSPYVIVAGDSDEAGESLPSTVAKVLKGHDVRYCKWPEGCKDPNDVLVKYGEGALANCLNAATRIDPPGGMITAISDIPPLDERRVLRIDEAPFSRVVAFELGTMSVWTGIPGNGKSTFLTWAAERVSVTENIRVGMLAFETHPHTLRDQLSLIRTGRDFCDLDAQARERFLDTVDKHFRLVHVVLDDDIDQHLKWLEEMVYTLAVRDGCKLIIVDPWNELEHNPLPGESMTQYINFATKFIRQLARKLDVHIALVAHPKKINSDGRVRAPSGYDVADSAAFFNKPSLGVTVHQNEDEDGNPYVELHVWKVRETRLYGFGKGIVKVEFVPERASYRRRVQPSEAA